VKIACLALMIIGRAALLHGASYPALSNTALQQATPESAVKSGKNILQEVDRATPAGNGGHRADRKNSNGDRGQRDASAKNHRRSSASLNEPVRLNPRRTQASGPTGVVAGGAAPKERVKSAEPVRPSRAASRKMTPPNNLRHHGSNSPSIDGSANRRLRNADAIDGTRMSQKP
jgi:hypothetical protein